jgi:hypothetical protein
LKKAQRRPIAPAEPQTERILQTQHQHIVPLLAGSVEGQDVCKVSAAELSPRRALGLLSNTSLKNRRQEFCQSQTSLGFLKSQGEERTSVSEQPQTTWQLSDEPARRELDQVIARDTNTNTTAHILSPTDLPIIEPAVKPLCLSAYPADTLLQWLEGIAKAGTLTRSSIRSPLVLSISDREATKSDMEGSRWASWPKNGRSAVTSEVYTRCERAPTIESRRKPQEERCQVPSLQHDLTSSASYIHANAGKTTYQDIAVRGETDTCMSKDPETLTTLDHVPPPSVDILDVPEGTLFNLLTQIVYTALCFDSSGSFRKCGSEQTALRPATSSNGGQTPMTPRKRPRESGYESNSGGNENQQPGKTKIRSVNSGNIGPTERRFACLHCKRDLSYGDDLKCVGWYSLSIDTVLRVSCFPLPPVFGILPAL